MTVYPEEKNYSIAIEFGLANEKAFYKFLKRHTGLTPTDFKKKLTKRDSNYIGLSQTCSIY